MIDIPPGFDMVAVAGDLFTIALPLFELVVIAFAAGLVINALNQGRKGLD